MKLAHSFLSGDSGTGGSFLVFSSSSLILFSILKASTVKFLFHAVTSLALKVSLQEFMCLGWARLYNTG